MLLYLEVDVHIKQKRRIHEHTGTRYFERDNIRKVY